jgi:hypothetical protein
VSSDRQELIRRFAVAIAGGHHISEYLRHEIPHDMIWRIAEFLADGESPQPEPQPQPTDDRMRRALQLIAQLADTKSRAHKERFQPNGEGDGIANGWRVAEAMREIANDVIGHERIEQPEHTREDWAEVQGNVTRLTQDVERLFGLAETLAGRIRRAAALLRGTPRYDTACGFAVPEDRIDEVVQILEGSDD